ncbi:MAG TPA: hypothetical protein VGL88_15735 [Pseudonocardiaceae bacterium]
MTEEGVAGSGHPLPAFSLSAPARQLAGEDIPADEPLLRTKARTQQVMSMQRLVSGAAE